MSKKKIALKLEFNPNGTVSFIGYDYGVPFTSHVDTLGTPKGDAFEEFSKAAHKFCRKLKDAGELG